jgi:hypothetical protein
VPLTGVERPRRVMKLESYSTVARGKNILIARPEVITVQGSDVTPNSAGGEPPPFFETAEVLRYSGAWPEC